MSSWAPVWVPLKADFVPFNSGHNVPELCLEGKITANPRQKSSHEEKT